MSKRNLDDQCRKCRRAVKTIATPAASQAVDDLGVALRAARLDDRAHAGVDRELRARRRTGRRRRRPSRRRRADAPRGARLVDRDPDRVDAAHLAGADADRAPAPWRARSRSSARACRRASRTAARPTPPRSACARVDDLISSRSSRPVSRSCTSSPPRTRFRSCSLIGARRRSWLSRMRTFGFCVSTSSASSVVAGREHELDEHRVQLLGQRAVDRAVEAEDAAERAHAGRSRARASNASLTIRADRRAARVVVLDDRRRRQLEVLDQPPARRRGRAGC